MRNKGLRSEQALSTEPHTPGPAAGSDGNLCCCWFCSPQHWSRCVRRDNAASVYLPRDRAMSPTGTVKKNGLLKTSSSWDSKLLNHSLLVSQYRITKILYTRHNIQIKNVMFNVATERNAWEWCKLHPKTIPQYSNTVLTAMATRYIGKSTQ